MVNDCLNRFLLLARAVEDNCSTLRPIAAHRRTTVSVVKGFAIACLWPRQGLGLKPAQLQQHRYRVVWFFAQTRVGRCWGKHDGGASCH